jgi:hypothetical protein
MDRIPWLRKISLEAYTNLLSVHSDLNILVMEYLLIEGYQAAALNFAKEANIKLQVDWTSMHDRIHIRNDIHMGNIQSAIERINVLHPEVSSIITPFAFAHCFPVPLLQGLNTVSMHHSQTFGLMMSIYL